MFGKLRSCLHGLQCESWVPWRLQPSLGLLQTLLLTVEHISLAPERAREGLRMNGRPALFSAPGLVRNSPRSR